jgi:hypothetical protein
MPVGDDETIRKILQTSKTIAVVGASVKPWRDSNSISLYLAHAGYQVIPINPKYEEVLGMRCYPNLKAVPTSIDIVDVFRNPDSAESIVDEAIAVKAKTVWMQLGVINEDAARKAEKAGLNVVMDRCILVDHRRLM